MILTTTISLANFVRLRVVSSLYILYRIVSGHVPSHAVELIEVVDAVQRLHLFLLLLPDLLPLYLLPLLSLLHLFLLLDIPFPLRLKPLELRLLLRVLFLLLSILILFTLAAALVGRLVHVLYPSTAIYTLKGLTSTHVPMVFPLSKFDNLVAPFALPRFASTHHVMITVFVSRSREWAIQTLNDCRTFLLMFFLILLRHTLTAL